AGAGPVRPATIGTERDGKTTPLCPVKAASSLPVAMAHKRTVWSSQPTASVLPSGLKATARTVAVVRPELGVVLARGRLPGAANEFVPLGAAAAPLTSAASAPPRRRLRRRGLPRRRSRRSRRTVQFARTLSHNVRVKPLLLTSIPKAVPWPRNPTTG